MKKRLKGIVAVVMMCSMLLCMTVSANQDILYGDYNKDAEVSSVDSIILSRFISNWIGYDNPIANGGDLNGDNTLTPLDSVVLNRHLAKWVGYLTLPYCAHTYVNGICSICNKTDGINAFTVTFVDYDGSVIKTQAVVRNASAIAPSDPVREGYAFDGWDKDFSNITSDLTVTAKYKEDSAPAFVISNATAAPGQTNVNITVALKNNPGISSLVLDTEYDTSLLTLTNVSYNSEVVTGALLPQKYDSPVRLYWTPGTYNVTGDFVFATLTFTVNESAASGSDAKISITYNPDDVYNLAEDNIDFKVISGKITIN